MTLSDANIRDYLCSPDRSYVIGRDFLGEIPSPWRRKHVLSFSSSKEKRPKVCYNPHQETSPEARGREDSEPVHLEIPVLPTWGGTTSFPSGSHSTAVTFSLAGPYIIFVRAPFAFLEAKDDEGDFQAAFFSAFARPTLCEVGPFISFEDALKEETACEAARTSS